MREVRSVTTQAGMSEMENRRFLDCGEEMLKLIVAYNEDLRNKRIPVMPGVDFKPKDLMASLPDQAPETAESFEQILQDVRDKIIPASTHWHHPNFFAYFPTSTSYPSILGDMLSGSIACIGFSW
ncbi:hypothetical protein Ciccas_014284, partial [Cichlidogyrus casuarinus]